MKTTTQPTKSDQLDQLDQLASSQNSQTPELSQPHELSQDIAEAERRGYLRGRNEALAERLAEPGLWEMADDADFFEPDDSAEPRGEVEVLRNIRPNVWDRF